MQKQTYSAQSNRPDPAGVPAVKPLRDLGGRTYRRGMSTPDEAIDSTGNQQGDSAQTDAVDTGLSDDIQDSLTAQGTTGELTVDEIEAQ